jgi:hypothetical protein
MSKADNIFNEAWKVFYRLTCCKNYQATLYLMCFCIQMFELSNYFSCQCNVHGAGINIPHTDLGQSVSHFLVKQERGLDKV